MIAQCLAIGVVIGFAGLGRFSEPFRVIEAKSAADLDALFVRKSGWLGADGNYSVQVTLQRTLWFFSDTWIGQIEHGRRVNSVLINNSVGVQTRGKNDSRVEFFWGSPTKEKPTAVFAPDDGRGWLWPFGGTCIADRLHLFLWQMERASGSAAFGFRSVAVWHGEVANPLDAPSKWRMTQRRLPFNEISEKRRLLFGSAVLKHGDYVYIYGVEERPEDKSFGRRMILARVEANAVGNFSRWCFWCGNVWLNDFRQVTPLASGIATEYSVTFIPALGKFVTVYHDAFLSPVIVARIAAEPSGPWSEPVALYTCQEPTWGKDIFCYSGKAHAALSSADELVISYAANSGRLSDVIEDTRLYWPKFIRVKLSGPTASGKSRDK